MTERCEHCGFVFEYDDETTIVQAVEMQNSHFGVEHADLVAQEGQYTHDLATGTVRYDVGPFRF